MHGKIGLIYNYVRLLNHTLVDTSIVYGGGLVYSKLSPRYFSHFWNSSRVEKSKAKNWMKFIGIFTEVSNWLFVKAIYLYSLSSGKHICMFSLNCTLFPEWDLSGT